MSADENVKDAATEETPLTWRDRRVLIPAALMFVLAALAVLAYPMPRPDAAWWKDAWWPAWVQAVGSVIAIFVAVLVPWAQNRKQQDRQDLDERHRRMRNMAAVLAIVSYVRFSLKNIAKELDDPDSNQQVLVHKVTALRRYLERVPLVSLENARVVGRFVGIFEGVASLEAAMLVDTSAVKVTVRALQELCTRFHRDFNGAHYELVGMMYLPEYREEF